MPGFSHCSARARASSVFWRRVATSRLNDSLPEILFRPLDRPRAPRGGGAQPRIAFWSARHTPSLLLRSRHARAARPNSATLQCARIRMLISSGSRSSMVFFFFSQSLSVVAGRCFGGATAVRASA